MKLINIYLEIILVWLAVIAETVWVWVTEEAVFSKLYPDN
jgi:hypothetical protein